MDTQITFIKLKIVGIIHFLFAVAILLTLIFAPYFRFILLILLPLMILYIVVGYGLFTLKLKTRTLVIIPAILVILFILSQVPHSINLHKHFLKGTVFPGGYVISMASRVLDILINGSLLLANLFIVYVLYFSKEKTYFQNKSIK